jgi:hypothetical protein
VVTVDLSKPSNREMTSVLLGFQQLSSLMEMDLVQPYLIDRPGVMMAKLGAKPRFPVVLIPGL